MTNLTQNKYPKTLHELRLYIQEHLDAIFIRDQNEDGSWDSISLEKLLLDNPERFWVKIEMFVRKFLEEGFIPYRVLSDDEVQANTDASLAGNDLVVTQPGSGD